MSQIDADIIHHGKVLDYTPVVIRSLEYHASDSTFWIVPNQSLRKDTLEMFRGSHCFSPSPDFMRGLRARRLIRVSTCYDGTFCLHTSMASPGLEPMFFDSAISILIHYTE
ncbi:hypothetical protein TNCV_672981 [Trichonephila clavipes]|nr:hypothetical protein TNCV_672981 [Trichonephila clavipes]